jgi:hypothetical protein
VASQTGVLLLCSILVSHEVFLSYTYVRMDLMCIRTGNLKLKGIVATTHEDSD